MANEIKEVVIGGAEKQLMIMKRYLPFVVIAALSWACVKQDQRIEKMRVEDNEHLQKDIDFARDAYQKSSDAYLLMVQKENDGKTIQSTR